MTKPDTKGPLHEVLSTRLDVATFGALRQDPEALRQVGFILDVFLSGKIPASAAHQIAGYFANLPSLLTKAGQDVLARSAELVLADLRGREDQKKEEKAEPVGSTRSE